MMAEDEKESPYIVDFVWNNGKGEFAGAFNSL